MPHKKQLAPFDSQQIILELFGATPMTGSRSQDDTSTAKRERPGVRSVKRSASRVILKPETGTSCSAAWASAGDSDDQGLGMRIAAGR